MHAEVISVGDELLSGAVLESNFQRIAAELLRNGLSVGRHTIVADSTREISASILEASERSDIVIVTGGLGPTVDDRTRQASAEASGKPLMFHPEILERIKWMFERRNQPMPESNRLQAMIPEGAQVIENPIGTAPGFSLRIGKALFFFLPGVPSEMWAMFAGSVLPRLQSELRGAGVIFERRLHTFGMAESRVNELLRDLLEKPAPRMGLIAKTGVIDIRLTATGDSLEEAKLIVAETEAEVRSRLGEAVFGSDLQTLESVVAEMLMEREIKIAVAESCTGGLLAKRLTDISGISSVFMEGWVTYSNEAKMKRLGVPARLIRQKGSVSAEVAKAMAEGARKRAGTDISLAVTGIAGPTGGTPDKPVGLTYVALASPEGTQVQEFRFPGNRADVRDRTVKAALNMVRLYLLKTAAH